MLSGSSKVFYYYDLYGKKLPLQDMAGLFKHCYETPKSLRIGKRVEITDTPNRFVRSSIKNLNFMQRIDDFEVERHPNFALDRLPWRSFVSE